MKRISCFLLVLFFGLILVGCHKHDYSENVVKATCTEQGYTEYTCSCGDTYKDNYVEAKGHTEVTVPGKEATCEKEGLSEGKNCAVCGIVLVKQEVVKAHGHKEQVVPGKAATCTETGLTDGSKCSECNIVLKEQEVIPAKGHTEEVVPGKAATCESTGLTDGIKCTVCNKMVKEQEIVPVAGHKGEIVPGKPATCTEAGTTDALKCTVCNKIVTDHKETPALGHVEVPVLGKAPTCSSVGLTEGTKCLICNITIKAQEEISKLAHTEEIIPGKAETCTESGLTEGSKCSVCGETIKAQEETPALGHTFGEWVVTKQPTQTEKGSKERTCAICSVKEIVEMPELDHVHAYEELVVAPTCTAKGYTKYTCSCGDTYQDKFVDEISHPEDKLPAKAATCTEKGLTEGIVCKDCGLVIKAQEEVPALGHKEEVLPGKAATCTEAGLTEGKKCTVCNEVLAVQEEIPALGHKEEVLPAKEATCTEAGLTEGKKCSNCGEIFTAQEEIPALGHKEEVLPAKEATCKEAGLTEGKKCTVCNEVLVAQQEVAKLAHIEEVLVEKAATCKEVGLTEGKKCTVCGEILVAQQEIPALGHKEEVLAAKEATCTQKGLTEGKKCSVCNEVLVAQEEVAMIPHPELTMPAVAPTCTTSGLTDGIKCSVCELVIKAQVEVPALGHEEEILVAKAPTCTEAGLTEGKKCTVCNEVLVAQEEVPALGHKEVKVEGVAATCTEVGLTEGTNCSVCGAVLKAQELIPALGHKEVAYDKAPTCTEAGLKGGATCSVCNAKLADPELIPALGHKEVALEAKAPTCTEAGLTAGSQCSVCKEFVVKQEEIPALGHDVEVIPAKEPTCTSAGYTEMQICMTCNTILVNRVELPVANHKVLYYLGKDPNCTENGYTYSAVCTVCDKVLVESTSIPNKGGHKFGEWVYTAPTQNEAGKDERICTVCGYADTKYIDKYEGSFTGNVFVPIRNKEDLLAFAEKVNAGEKFNDAIVYLLADIDLANEDWTPLNLWDPENGTKLVIDGQGHAISNLSVNGSSYSAFIGLNARDLTIFNITFDNATVVTSGSQSAVVIGQQYGDVVLEEVNVTSSTVTSTASKGIRLGGLIGHSMLHDGASLTITNCLVDDVQVSGYHNIAGLVGTLNNYDDIANWSITDTTVSNCTFIVTSANEKYGSAFAVEGANYPHTYEQSNTYFEALGNTQTGNEVKYGIQINTVEELLAFAKDVNENQNTYKGWTVSLGQDIDLDGIEWKPIGNVVSYPSITFAGTFNGNGYTVSNMTTSDDTVNHAAAGFFGSITGKVMNLTIDNATVTSTHYAGGVVAYIGAETGAKVVNCHVTNSTITSTTEWLEDDSKWDNGDKVGGIVGYLVKGDFVDNCSVDNVAIKGYRDLGGIVGFAGGTVTNCKVDNVTITVDKTNNYKGYTKDSEFDANEIVGEGTADATNTASNVEFFNKAAVADSAELSTVLASSTGKVELELEAATYALAGTALAGKEITFVGVEGTKVDATTIPGTSGASITFENIEVQFPVKNYHGFTHTTKVVYKDCTIKGLQFLYAPEVEFINCVFENKNDYCVWTYGASDVTFTNCIFNTGGKAVLVYIEDKHTAEITLNDCTFNSDSSLASDKAAVEVGSSPNSADTKYTIIINNCNITGFAANNSTSPLWGNKNSMDADHLNVLVDEVDVY